MQMSKWKVGTTKKKTLPVSFLAKFYRENILNISQRDLEAMTGAKQANISAFEAGRPSPQVHNAYLDIGLSEFADTISDREADVLNQLYTGYWQDKVYRALPSHTRDLLRPYYTPDKDA